MNHPEHVSREAACIVRHPRNPILTRADVPYGCDRVYNPAVCKLNDEYILLLRTENYDHSNQRIGLARSRDGVNFTVEPQPVLAPSPEEMGSLNDPRVTFIDGWYYLTYCSDPGGNGLREEGIFLCIARSKDLHTWERIYKSQPDNRNAVLFPEKINGLYARLDRPFRRGYRREHGHDIWISYSPDMEFWGHHKLVLSFYDVPWGSHKIGPGCPPIRTDKGWLTIFHGAELVTPDEKWLPWAGGRQTKVYRAGIMLLDLADPSRIIGMRQEPLMEPVTAYEKDTAYRPNIVFPTGTIVEPDGEVKIYYGASDTTVCLATASMDELVGLCG